MSNPPSALSTQTWNVNNDPAGATATFDAQTSHADWDPTNHVYVYKAVIGTYTDPSFTIVFKNDPTHGLGWYDHGTGQPTGAPASGLGNGSTIDIWWDVTWGSGTANWIINNDSFFQNYSISSSGPTVTSITVNEPRIGPLNTGVGPDFYKDGTIVSNDTILASDITLYKDDQPYSNSNVTMHGNDFEITFSGSAHYTIQCGGQTAFVTHQDESWRTNITSNSSQRSTNVVRIRNILSTIPSNLNIYIRTLDNQSGNWSTWSQASYNQRIQSNTWVEWRYESQNWIEIFKFTLGNVAQNATNPHLYDVMGRISVHKWDKNDPTNSPTLHNSPWYVIGESYRGEIRSYVGRNDATVGAAGGNFYDPNYQAGAGALRSYQLMVHDWVYFAQLEGADEGPDGNPPNNEPPSTGDGDTNNDGSDDPKHQYPGNRWNTRRRRAHSFW